MAEPRLTRHHRARLLQIWRSAGWPCRDGIEIDLLAAQWLCVHTTPEGRDTLRLTAAGIEVLADARRRGARELGAHDRLAQKFAEHLMRAGRIVWRELSLRAAIDAPPTGQPVPEQPPAVPTLWQDAGTGHAAPASVWRIARPDLYSVRNTSVEAYLQPMVHEVKATRADLLSDLRHAAKRQAYQWLCSECHYVFPVAVARPEEIPEAFGVWVLHGNLEDGHFEQLRPARHARCTLPFAVWLALARATPLRSDIDIDSAQSLLGDAGPGRS